MDRPQLDRLVSHLAETADLGSAGALGELKRILGEMLEPLPAPQSKDDLMLRGDRMGALWIAADRLFCVEAFLRPVLHEDRGSMAGRPAR